MVNSSPLYILYSLLYYSIYLVLFLWFFLILFILFLSFSICPPTPAALVFFWMLLVCVFYLPGGCSWPFGRCLALLRLFFVLQVCTFLESVTSAFIRHLSEATKKWRWQGTHCEPPPYLPPRLQRRLHPSSCTTNDRQLLGKYSQGSRSGIKHPILPRIRWQSHSRTGLSVSPRMPFAYAATIEIFLFWRALITRAPLGLHPTVLNQRDRKARKTVASHARNSGDFRAAFNADSSHAYERVNERLTWQRLF